MLIKNINIKEVYKLIAKGIPVVGGSEFPDLLSDLNIDAEPKAPHPFFELEFEELLRGKIEMNVTGINYTRNDPAYIVCVNGKVKRGNFEEKCFIIYNHREHKGMFYIGERMENISSGPSKSYLLSSFGRGEAKFEIGYGYCIEEEVFIDALSCLEDNHFAFEGHLENERKVYGEYTIENIQGEEVKGGHLVYM